MTNGSPNSYRFSFWLPVFAVLLILIPISIWSGLIGLAKICGVSVLLLLIFAMRKWFSLARSKNNRLERVQLNANDLYLLQQILPSFKEWPSSEQHILTDQIGLFLAEVSFIGAWTPKTQLSVAIITVCATWKTGYINKQGWRLYIREASEFYFEPEPNTIYSIPTTPLLEKDASALQNNVFITAFKKGLENSK